MAKVWLYKKNNGLEIYIPEIQATVVLSGGFYEIESIKIGERLETEEVPDIKIEVSEKYIKLVKTVISLEASLRGRTDNIVRRVRDEL